MAAKNQVLEFDDRASAVEEAIDRFKAILELQHRSGCFGLMGLFSKNLPKDQQQKLNLARQIIEQLGVDAAKKGHFRGRLDLSGFKQKQKVKRVGKSQSGNPKTYYRDRWFYCRFRTVDGSEARLAIREDVKVKKGTAVRKARLALKLVPNTKIYTVVQPTGGILQRTYPVALVEMLARPDGIRLAGAVDSPEFKTAEVMRVVKAAYDCMVLSRTMTHA